MSSSAPPYFIDPLERDQHIFQLTGIQPPEQFEGADELSLADTQTLVRRLQLGDFTAQEKLLAYCLRDIYVLAETLSSTAQHDLEPAELMQAGR